jgi:putative polyhydroxyalkanoate system protein
LSEIHITRHHALGLPEARKLAFKWAEAAEQELDMACNYEEGKTSDRVTFQRTGAHGELKVTRDKFVLDAKLGLLLAAFRHKIETEIVRNLDQLLAHEEPSKAFDHVVAKRAVAKKASHKKKHPT